jgi:hypothetical protein
MKKHNRMKSRLTAAMESMELRRLLATFSASVFNDLNTNGVWDTGEPGAAGHTIYADYNYNNALDAGEPTAVTDSSGHYSLVANLQPFPLRIVTAPGWQTITPLEGETRSVNVRNGNELFSYNSTFGVAHTSTSQNVLVTGYVYVDRNGNQMFDPLDNTRSGRTVWADYDSDNVIDPSEPQTIMSDVPLRPYSLTTKRGSFPIRTVLRSPQSISNASIGSNGVLVDTTSLEIATLRGANLALYSPVSTLEGTLYFDRNSNGFRQSTEPVVPGQTLWLDVDRNGVRDASDPSTISDASGYFFLASIPGQFDLDLHVIPTPGVTAPGVIRFGGLGEPVISDFNDIALGGAINPSTILGAVYSDTNQNGRRDAGEAGLANRIVFADYNYDGVRNQAEPSVATNVDGSYALMTRENEISLRVVLNAEEQLNFGYGSTSIWLSTVGGTATGKNFGIASTATTSITRTLVGGAFFDVNSDGMIGPGELPAGAGHLVWADADNDGVLDAGDPHTTTRADGGYTLTLTGLPTAQYIIRVMPLPGFETSVPYALPLVLGSFGGAYALNIGIKPPVAANRVTGTIYSDTDRDGRLDSGEAGLANRTVFADYDYDGVLDANEPRALTDASGNYSLATRASQVSLRVLLNAGEQLTLGYGATSIWLSTVNGTVTGKNFGVASAAALNGEVQLILFIDANRNGVRDAGERLRHITALWDDLNANNRLDAGEPRYDVSQPVPADAYKLTLPLGTHHIAYNIAFFGIEYSGVFGLRDVTLTASEPVVSLVTPIWLDESTITVSSRVYFDVNRNGQDDDEPGVAGQSVYADYNNNGTLDTGEPVGTTDSRGYYGLYVTQPTFPVRLITTIDYAQVSPGGNGSAPYDYVTAPGQLSNFGVIYASTSFVTGTIYADANRNGRRDPGEAGLADRTVFADYNYNGVLDAIEPRAISDASGNYTLGTRASQVSVRVVLNAGEQLTLGYGASSIWLSTVNGTVTGKNFGIAGSPGTTTVSGFVYNDANRNGRRDSGEEPGPEQLFIYADLNNNGSWDTGEPSDQSDSNDGSYTLAGVSTGASFILRAVRTDIGYGPAIVFTEPTPWHDPARAISTQNGPVAGVNFGLTTSGAVKLVAYAFLDVDQNGQINQYDTEIGVADVWVDLNGNRLHDANEPTFYEVQPGLGDPNPRRIKFIDVPTGTWNVALRYWNDTDLLADEYRTVTASPTAPPVYFTQPPVGSVMRGVVFLDANENGTFDAGEGNNYSDLFIYADYDNNGSRSLDEPAVRIEHDGTYVLNVGNRSGTLRLGTLLFDPHAIQIFPLGIQGYAFNFAATTNSIGNDFGFVFPNIVGRVFSDPNGNGRLDSFEGVLEGRRVFADYNYNGVWDANEPSDLTDVNGDYGLYTRRTNVSLRVVLNAGEQLTLGYGATSIWLSTVTGTVSGKNFGISMIE